MLPATASRKFVAVVISPRPPSVLRSRVDTRIWI
jgi:hypothetical protein